MATEHIPGVDTPKGIIVEAKSPFKEDNKNRLKSKSKVSGGSRKSLQNSGSNKVEMNDYGTLVKTKTSFVYDDTSPLLAKNGQDNNKGGRLTTKNDVTGNLQSAFVKKVNTAKTSKNADRVQTQRLESNNGVSAS